MIGSKSETLLYLQDKITRAKVLPQICFTVREWRKAEKNFTKITEQYPSWFDFTTPLIVRSSALSEDQVEQSCAGHFTSVTNVVGDDMLVEAIDVVVSSFDGQNSNDQVFVQPMLEKVVISGVVFTRDPTNGAHQLIINYDDTSGDTTTVTAGSSNNLKTYYHFKGGQSPSIEWLGEILLLAEELESIFDCDSLDFEFAINSEGELFLFQVRSLIHTYNTVTFDLKTQLEFLQHIESHFNLLSGSHPYLLGKRSIFGVMPDWNPAEIIGTRPRALALSLYRELVTDKVWAYQRDNYGYRNLRSFPLMVNFFGLPYIDVRVSFNSFIPASLEKNLAEKLVNYYIDQLIKNPNHHDKVEFDVLFSCYTLDLDERLIVLKESGFTDFECELLSNSLRDLTNKIINSDTGLWKVDLRKILVLEERQEKITNSNLDKLGKIYWLLEDCKRYGTLPFAGLARAGFIAVQILSSLVRVGILSDEEYQGFMSSLTTVSSSMSNDFINLSMDGFLKKYGHLRPGTYDILSPRYDEKPEQYFDFSSVDTSKSERNESQFLLSIETMNNLTELLNKHDLQHDVLSLFNFLRDAIEGREYAKFVFTKSLSHALQLISELGNEYDISTEDMSYVNIQVLQNLYTSTNDFKEVVQDSIVVGKAAYEKTCSINLPPLITSESDIWSFQLPSYVPNYITLKTATGEVVNKDAPNNKLKNNILMIPSADPGYDWIFSHGIGGFITMYGGANSHMAIRAVELGIPAVIGVGDVLFKQWSRAELLHVDCSNKQVRILR